MKTKEELKRQSKIHQQALEHDFEEIIVEGKRTAKKAALVAGGILLTYLVVRAITRKKVVVRESAGSQNFYENPPQKSGVVGTMGKMILTEAAILGMKFAKEKVKDYIDNLMETDDDPEDPTK
ncbi:hypothetical protein [Fulvivirga sedimenti]|uniref:Uncharacterized protein n=1 Tax=Fulvivirga sedimenti TaxID=2879465 RepID=A0A9X1KWW6_9BACT|nr:hypothetical protein [Fulvivirga sedimenti]MCA6074374.1 hypothetical protein [Fulvivirga sedimenti]